MKDYRNKFLEDFAFFQSAGFADSYSLLCHAMENFYCNWPIAAVIFRQALESIVIDSYNLIGITCRTGNLSEKIKFLEACLGEEYLSGEVLRCMRNIRCYGNAYAHLCADDRDYDKDQCTFYMSALTVAHWLADLKDDHPVLNDEEWSVSESSHVIAEIDLSKYTRRSVCTPSHRVDVSVAEKVTETVLDKETEKSSEAESKWMISWRPLLVACSLSCLATLGVSHMIRSMSNISNN